MKKQTFTVIGQVSENGAGIVFEQYSELTPDTAARQFLTDFAPRFGAVIGVVSGKHKNLINPDEINAD